MEPRIDEAKKVIPRLSADHFRTENRAAECGYVAAVYNMLQLNGWNLVGYAYARDVAERDGREYVLLFENESGLKVWMHAHEGNLIALALTICERREHQT